MKICPVCIKKNSDHFSCIEDKIYYRCNECKAIYLDHRNHLTNQDERKRYELHNNDIYDERYREFLSKLHDPIIEKIEKGAKGLDYGCGPGPALALMFKEENFSMDIYDPYFFPDNSFLNKKYDFVTCSEAAEHFLQPLQEFKKIDQILVKGGWFGLMTNFYDDSIYFEDWYYRKDPTHVVFYSFETLDVLAAIMSWNYEKHANNVVLFQK
ncbi:MAG: methyltransferase type 12 [Verrucomicrobiaceae bacterium]|nr:methyltransferase type 12 [Verrucomicrobiaceae bacterium]|tara:strand:- start:3028 stop:3660 length:633 start_codon:yes stop_codon:yes gene_type:complete